MSSFLMNPVLYADGSSKTEWRFRVGVVVEGEDAAAISLGFFEGDAPAKDLSVDDPVQVWSGHGRTQQFCQVVVQRADHARRLRYRVFFGGDEIEISNLVVPAIGALPRTAFFSCNGCDSRERYLTLKEPNAVWDELLVRHFHGDELALNPEGPYHLLIGAGDQVYCDSVFVEVPELAAWKEMRFRDRVNFEVDDDLFSRIERYYFDLYAQRWGRSRCGEVFSCIPTLFTWDDHDIFDGYGSHEDELNRCPVVRALYRAAETAFLTLQLGGALPRSAAHYLRSIEFDDELRVIALDLRSGRTPERVMSNTQRADLMQHLDAIPKGGHALIISSVPVVFTNLALVERALSILPGRQVAEDDLRDMWESPAHAGERTWLCMNLLRAARERDARITILSGEMHVGARGRISSVRAEHARGLAPLVIEQITASGIVFPPPGTLGRIALLAISNHERDEIANGAWTEMMRVSQTDELLFERNYLSIEPDLPPLRGARRLWCRWITERGSLEPPVVIEAGAT